MDEVFVISRIIKVEVGVIGWGWQPLLRPWLFWISQKPNLIILFYYTLNKSFLSRFNIKCFQSLCQLFLFLKFSQFFSLSRNQQTAPSPSSSTFMCLWVLVFNYFFDVLLSQWSKPGSHVFASSCTDGKQHKAPRLDMISL